MPRPIRWYLPLPVIGALILLTTGCSSTGNGSSSVYLGVYGGYGYPYHDYGYGGCCYPPPGRPDRPDRPDRPERPGGPSILPVPDRPGGPSILPVPDRPGGPSIQPVPKPRPSATPRRPSAARMGRPARMPRGRR